MTLEPTELMARGRLQIENGIVHVWKAPGGKRHSFYNVNENPFYFHFAIWLSQNSVNNFCVWHRANFMDEETREQVIMFGDEEDYHSYKEWRQEYDKRFPGQNPDEHCVPTIPETGKYTLTLINVSSDEEESQKMFEMWGWIVNNCSGLVFRVSHTKYAFENEDEAVLFKMLHHDV